MKTSAFERLDDLSADYELSFLAIRAAVRDGREVIAAIKQRLASERARDQARAEELQAQSEDRARSETVRRMAAQELQRLQAAQYQASPEELAAFNECRAEIEKVVSEAAALRLALNEAITEATKAINEIRAKSYKGKDLEIEKSMARTLSEELAGVLDDANRGGLLHD